MKRTMLAAALFAVSLLAVPACTMSNASMASGKQKQNFTHAHSHNHRGVPRHHDGTYHKITRVHEHAHTPR